MRRFIPLFLLVLGLAITASLAYVFRPVPPQPTAPEGPRALVTGLPSFDDLLQTVPEGGETASATEPSILRDEDVAPPPVQYLPPPTQNLSGSSLGRQRVPVPDSIGDIHKLAFHNPTQTLFMAVTEPDGLRSVWRLMENGRSERVFALSAAVGEIRIHQDSKGVLYVQQDNPVRLYRSDDGFKTWKTVLEGEAMFWSIADDGKGGVYATTHERNRAVLYRSLDDGISWEPWIDFQKLFPQYAQTYREGDDRYMLRHLHGVIYDRAKEQILVGTGDVARFTFMSADNGQTWQAVWDEGFTASVAMSGGFRWMLGPDQLAGHGLAVYDAEKQVTREVWNPIPHGYAGYTYSLLNVNGIYYAAFHTEANEVAEVVPKFGIIASPDGDTWYPFLQWGPLSNHARTDVWLTSASSVVYASVNGALYAFRPLDRDWFVGKEAF